MNKARINFANGYTLCLSDADRISPIVRSEDENGSFASRGRYVLLCPHVQDGLIPPILDVLCSCDFFAVQGKNDVIFCTKSIVSIESI